ncbi:hypothetical protein [Streptomyces klenkii]|uniref:hypothetical protein n=1 Tax=Streptomyces klenkii TaxID=1420899 RepID=UPI003BAEA13F
MPARRQTCAGAAALCEAALSGALGGDQAVLPALLKLRQVLSRRIADRPGEMDAAFVHTPRNGEPQITAGMLLELAAACRRDERARLSYRGREGTSRELFEENDVARPYEGGTGPR